MYSRASTIFSSMPFAWKLRKNPDADSGLRRPVQPDKLISNKEVTADELFEVARLVIAAEIAKIHTIEWTTQLLYNEPVYLAMNANWSGLFDEHPLVSAALEQVIQRFTQSDNGRKATGWYAAFAAGPGIVGLGNTQADVNAGVNHFGSPFNFPEEFINAYRLHPMLPDFIEFRELNRRPQRDQIEDCSFRNPAWQSDSSDASARAGQLGTLVGTAATRQADLAKPSEVFTKPVHASPKKWQR